MMISMFNRLAMGSGDLEKNARKILKETDGKRKNLPNTEKNKGYYAFPNVFMSYYDVNNDGAYDKGDYKFQLSASDNGEESLVTIFQNGKRVGQLYTNATEFNRT